MRELAHPPAILEAHLRVAAEITDQYYLVDAARHPVLQPSAPCAARTAILNDHDGHETRRGVLFHTTSSGRRSGNKALARSPKIVLVLFLASCFMGRKSATGNPGQRFASWVVMTPAQQDDYLGDATTMNEFDGRADGRRAYMATSLRSCGMP